MRVKLLRCLLIAAALLVSAAEAQANDAFQGTWNGTVGTNTVIMKIDRVSNGACFGSYNLVGLANYSLSDGPPKRHQCPSEV